MGSRRGLTLIEVLIALFLLSLLAVGTLSFVKYNDTSSRRLSSGVDEETNLRIALDYFTRVIQSGEEIRLIKVEGSGPREVDFILAENRTSSPLQYMEMDGEEIFLSDNIIRRETESQHIVSGIESFWVRHMGGGLYTVGVSSKGHSVSTRIYKRK